MALEHFDLMARNLLSGYPFVPAREYRFDYPIDIWATEDSLELRVAAVGLEKEDIEIEIDGDRLGITYDKAKKEASKCNCSPCTCVSIHNGISRKSFSLGYKVSAKFDLSQLKASLDKGELKISIPMNVAAKPQKIKIS